MFKKKKDFFDSVDSINDGTSSNIDYPEVILDHFNEKNDKSGLRLHSTLAFPDSIKNYETISSKKFYNSTGTDYNDNKFIGKDTEFISDDAISVDEFLEKKNVSDDNAECRNSISKSFKNIKLKSDAIKNEEFLQNNPSEIQEKKKLELTKKSLEVQNKVYSAILKFRIIFQKILTNFHQVPKSTNSQLPMVNLSSDLTQLFALLRQFQRYLLVSNNQIKEFIKKKKSPENLHSLETKESQYKNPFYIQRRKRYFNEMNKSNMDKNEILLWSNLEILPQIVKEWAFNVADYWFAKTTLQETQKFKVFNQTPSFLVDKMINEDYVKIFSKTCNIPLSKESSNSNSEYNISNCKNEAKYDDLNFYITLLKDYVNQCNGNINIKFNEENNLRTSKQKRTKRNYKNNSYEALKERWEKKKNIPELLGFMSAIPLNPNNQFNLYNSNTNQQNAFFDNIINSLLQ